VRLPIFGYACQLSVVCSLHPGMFTGPVVLYLSRTGSSYDLLCRRTCVCFVLAIFDDDDHDMFACPFDT
jgi:hypothetical protein